MSTLKVDTITTISGTGNINVSRPLSGSGASLTSLPAANLTGTLPAISGASLTSLTAANLTGALPAISGASLTNLPGGGNSPRFWTQTGIAQTITSGTVTRVTGWPATGNIDVGSCYASSRFTVPSGEAGDYMIGANLSFHDSNGDLTQVYTKFYKNGSWYYGGYGASWNTSTNGAVHWADQAIMIATLSVGDYIDVYGQAVGTGTIRVFTNDGGNQRFANFWGYKIG